METVKQVEYSVESLEGLTEKALLRQIIYRMDRQANPDAENDVIAASNAATVKEMIEEIAVKLELDDFPDVAARVRAVVS